MIRNKGFSIIEVGIIIVLIAAVAGVSYLGWRAFTASSQSSGQDTSKSAGDSSAQSVGIITTKADLESAEKELNELNFTDDSFSEAEAQANL